MRRIPVTLATLALALAAGSSVAHAQCGITGSPVIGASPANLCGTGGMSYRWEGPNGFAATTRCVAITQPGDYRLFAFDSDVGLWFGPCAVTVTGDTVVVPPPPPPAVDTMLNCPRAAWFWTRACRSNERTKPLLTPQQIAAVAAAVDQRAQSLAWSDAASGFCTTLRMQRENDHRARAMRQFAGVLANVAANSLHLMPSDGREVHLRENTVLAADDARGLTLAQWIAETDGTLMTLASVPPTDRRARKAYQQIRRVGWMLNHGMGVGEVCKPVPMASGPIRDDDESMTMAFSDDALTAGFTMESASPNPFRDQTRIAFTLESGAEVDLSVVDLSGRMVRNLMRGTQAAGRHELIWDGRGDAGQPLPAGAYFVHGRVGEARVQGRIVMIH